MAAFTHMRLEHLSKTAVIGLSHAVSQHCHEGTCNTQALGFVTCWLHNRAELFTPPSVLPAALEVEAVVVTVSMKCPREVETLV